MLGPYPGNPPGTGLFLNVVILFLNIERYRPQCGDWLCKCILELLKDSVLFCGAVMQSRDPSTNVVLLEDAAAVLGVIMAAGCMGLTSLTGKSFGSLPPPHFLPSHHFKLYFHID